MEIEELLNSNLKVKYQLILDRTLYGDSFMKVVYNKEGEPIEIERLDPLKEMKKLRS